ncbi:fluoride efflux transporter CrcB [Helicobacter pylori]
MILNILLIGLAGICGALLRYIISNFINSRNEGRFPWSTMFINILGSILMGVLIALTLNNQILLILSVGFLGSFTTFSTFIKESFTLLNERNFLLFITYIAFSYVISIVCCFLSITITQNLS